MAPNAMIIRLRVDVQVTANDHACVRVGCLNEIHQGSVVLGLLGAVRHAGIRSALEVVVDHINILVAADADARAIDAEQPHIRSTREAPVVSQAPETYGIYSIEGLRVRCVKIGRHWRIAWDCRAAVQDGVTDGEGDSTRSVR